MSELRLAGLNLGQGTTAGTLPLEQQGLSVLCWWGWVVRVTLFSQGFPCCSLPLQDPLWKNICEEQCAVNQLLFSLEESAGAWSWSQHAGAGALGIKSLILVRLLPLPGGKAEGPMLSYSGVSGTHTSHFVAEDTVPEAFLHSRKPGASTALDSYRCWTCKYEGTFHKT